MVNQQFAFAVHTLTALSVNKQGAMTSDQIAKSVNTNPVVIRRLLAKLSKNALVETQLGKNGGVKLKKKPQDITLKDIYMAINDKKLISENENAANKKCPISCKMKTLMKDIIDNSEKATLKYLSTIKLSELSEQI